jgi:beta-lactamase class A
MGLTVFQLVNFSRVRMAYPIGTRIAGVPVGGLTQNQAADRLVQAYGLPIELQYGDAVIQVKPLVVGFELDLQGMLAVADLQRVSRPFWTAFWDYLWNRSPTTSQIPLSATISESRIRSYLQDEVAVRYDQPATAAMPVPGSTAFRAGQPGTILDIDRAVIMIEDALRSSTSRKVKLSFNQVNPPRPALQNLEILLKQIIDISGFDGLTEIYMVDLQSNEELHFAYQLGSDMPGDIAFTAASTMKIPIMVSIFRRLKEPAPAQDVSLLELMIERSENDPADLLMQTVIDKDFGPLKVTEDLQSIGLNNTFLGGYFYPGAPLLKLYTTVANQRTDISTDPDIYNQTTPMEIGWLLDDIYQCAQTGGGTLIAAFPGEISQAECRLMITYLTRNRIAVLLEAGLPEGVQIAHKHGWITSNDGLIHTIGDAGIVYTPGGNYVITIFLYQPVQLLFDPANQLVAQISTAVYNYFNLR